MVSLNFNHTLPMKRQGFSDQSQLHVELSNYARLHIRQNINMCVWHHVAVCAGNIDDPWGFMSDG